MIVSNDTITKPSYDITSNISQTQAMMNKEAAESYQKAGKELNETYQAILADYMPIKS